MTRRMLVDATHPEEIRVAIIQDNKLVDLDIETANKEQIKGNIYLGKVSRVEPSLQAAFIEFHNGRQGFLSVNDIHPKYFTPGGLSHKEVPVIEPIDDGQDDDEENDTGDTRNSAESQESPLSAAIIAADGTTLDTPVVDLTAGDDPPPPSAEPNETEGETAAGEIEEEPPYNKEIEEEPPHHREEEEEDRPPLEETRRQHRRRPPPIQKILQRNQTVLVQVVKESRGNKGATLTTNLSLAGRYTVLLPENPGGGGISRKITDAAERKNLKAILGSLPIPPEMSLIIRTAGMERNKREFSRDISYLTRLWKMILEGAETKKAPCLIHEEGDLIIRTIRDLYTTDMEEILIEGQEGYRLGKDFMRLLMPRYVKVVQPYKESVPLFARYQVESQIETMHERLVQLKLGSYLVIDTTEALVTIDINSGRSTREKDVESTAFKTNIQAVDEIARQLRLRDLGGLVVIDFIDMEDRKHIQEVEKRVKDAFKSDRAKVQIGRISQFGLLELSRQRLRPTFNETNRSECPRCKGLGTIRSVESAAVYMFRCIEEEVALGKYQTLSYNVSPEVVNYLFNHKRAALVRLEESNQIAIRIHADTRLQPPDFTTAHSERSKKEKIRDDKTKTPKIQEEPEAAPVEAKPEAIPVVTTQGPETPPPVDASDANKKKRRRKRRRKKSFGPNDPATKTTVEPGNVAKSGANPGNLVDLDQEDEEIPPPPPSPPAQDMRHVEALAMRFPGLYTLHEVTTSKPAEDASSLPEDDFEMGPQDSEPGTQDDDPGKIDAATKRKRPRRGGRGRGRSRKPGTTPKESGGDGQTPDTQFHQENADVLDSQNPQ